MLPTLNVNKGIVTGGCDGTFISLVRVQEFRDWLVIGNLFTPITVVGWNNLKHPFGNRRISGLQYSDRETGLGCVIG